MSRITILSVLLILPVMGIAQDDNSFRFWQELVTADTNFSQAATERGRTEAFLEVLGEGSVLFREGPVDARELYRENQSLYSLDQLSWRRHFIDVSRDGDLGITVGPNVYTANPEEQDEANRQQSYSHLANVWHKVDGEWKLMLILVVRVPGFLSMDVEPDYRATQQMLSETAHPGMTVTNEMEGLIEADNTFGLAINYRGGQRALNRYGLVNQRVYLPGMAPAIGVEAASVAYGNFLDSRIATTNPVTVSFKGGYLSTSKELGYTYGVMTTNATQGGSGFRANYLRVWRFTSLNEWKVAMEFISEF